MGCEEDLVFGRLHAEGEADAAPRRMFIAAHREHHVGGLGVVRRTRRPARGRYSVQVERIEKGLAPLKGDVRDVGNAASPVHGHLFSQSGGKRPLEKFPKFPRVAAELLPFLGGKFERFCHSHGRHEVGSPPAQAAFLLPAHKKRTKGNALLDDENARPLGSAELVRGEGDGVRIAENFLYVLRASRLNAIGKEYTAAGMGGTCDFGEGLQASDLIIGTHDRNKTYMFGHGMLKIRQNSVPVHLSEKDGRAPHGRSGEHCGVLRRGKIQGSVAETANCPVVGLRPSGGKIHLPRGDAEHAGNAVARVEKRSGGLSSRGVERIGVGKQFRGGEHFLRDFPPKGSRCRIVEIRIHNFIIEQSAAVVNQNFVRLGARAEMREKSRAADGLRQPFFLLFANAAAYIKIARANRGTNAKSRGVVMNDELRYAEMLEIPVETVTVSRKEKKKRREELSDKLVKEVNEKMAEDPAYAESTSIERNYEKKPRSTVAKRVLVGELAAVVVLCLGIFLTNIFLPDSAINTFVKGLFRGDAAAADTRTYSDFNLSSVVSPYDDVEISVSDTGVMTFTAACTVYAPCAGKVERVSGNAEEGYYVVLRHSDSFTTLISGLDSVYLGEGDSVYNTPLAHADGSRAVRVMFYDNETLITNYTLGEGGISWS